MDMFKRLQNNQWTWYTHNLLRHIHIEIIYLNFSGTNGKKGKKKRKKCIPTSPTFWTQDVHKKVRKCFAKKQTFSSFSKHNEMLKMKEQTNVQVGLPFISWTRSAYLAFYECKLPWNGVERKQLFKDLLLKSLKNGRHFEWTEHRLPNEKKIFFLHCFG